MKKMFVILGLIVMMMFVLSCAPGNFAGQAVGTSQTKCIKDKNCKDTYNKCLQDKNCRYAQNPTQCSNDCLSSAFSTISDITSSIPVKEDTQKLTLIEFNEIKKFYGNGDFQSGKSAEVICDDIGCGGCFAGEIEEHFTYYESTGNVCSDPQMYDFDSELSNCDRYGLAPVMSPCYTDTSSMFKEPILGDYRFQSTLTGVICSGCPANLVKELKTLPWPEESSSGSGDGSASS